MLAVNDLAARTRVRRVAEVGRRRLRRGRGSGAGDPGVDRAEHDDRATGGDNRGDPTLMIFKHRASPLVTDVTPCGQSGTDGSGDQRADRAGSPERVRRCVYSESGPDRTAVAVEASESAVRRMESSSQSRPVSK